MKNKLYAISKEQLSKLPVEVQEEVKSALRAYDECHITFEYGKYEVSVAVSIKKAYAPDHKFIGTAYVEDIYTLEERTKNYIEVFHDYPIWYTGKRDYKALHEQYGNPPIFD